MSLKDIQTKAKQKPPRILLYGGAGIGKTTFAASMTKPIFLITEDGLGQIKVPHFPLIKSFDTIIERLQTLVDDDHDYKTVVVDSLDWLEPLVWEKCCKDNNWKNIEQPGFGKGYKVALSYWRSYIDLMNKLRDQRGMTIMQLAHNQIKKFESPEIEPYDRHEIKLQRAASDVILEHADCCFFTNYKLGTVKVQGKGGNMTTKAVAGDRVIYTSEKPAFLAKNRYALPDEMPFDWQSIRAEMIKTKE
jgi:hypothetical protein